MTRRDSPGRLGPGWTQMVRRDSDDLEGGPARAAVARPGPIAARPRRGASGKMPLVRRPGPAGVTVCGRALYRAP